MTIRKIDEYLKQAKGNVCSSPEAINEDQQRKPDKETAHASNSKMEETEIRETTPPEEKDDSTMKEWLMKTINDKIDCQYRFSTIQYNTDSKSSD